MLFAQVHLRRGHHPGRLSLLRVVPPPGAVAWNDPSPSRSCPEVEEVVLAMSQRSSIATRHEARGRGRAFRSMVPLRRGRLGSAPQMACTPLLGASLGSPNTRWTSPMVWAGTHGLPTGRPCTWGGKNVEPDLRDTCLPTSTCTSARLGPTTRTLVCMWSRPCCIRRPKDCVHLAGCASGGCSTPRVPTQCAEEQ